MAKEKLYILIALSCSGLGGAVYRKRDNKKFKASDFPPGHAEKYITSGHLAYADGQSTDEDAIDLSKDVNGDVAIPIIEAMTDAEAIRAYVEGDKRKGVNDAADERIDELTATSTDLGETEAIDAINLLDNAEKIEAFTMGEERGEVTTAAFKRIQEINK